MEQTEEQLMNQAVVTQLGNMTMQILSLQTKIAMLEKQVKTAVIEKTLKPKV